MKKPVDKDSFFLLNQDLLNAVDILENLINEPSYWKMIDPYIVNHYKKVKWET